MSADSKLNFLEQYLVSENFSNTYTNMKDGIRKLTGSLGGRISTEYDRVREIPSRIRSLRSYQVEGAAAWLSFFAGVETGYLSGMFYPINETLPLELRVSTGAAVIIGVVLGADSLRRELKYRKRHPEKQQA